MPENIIHKVNYLLVGLGIGSVFGILFAPKSGQETREYLLATEDKKKRSTMPARKRRNYGFMLKKRSNVAK